jgi:hypothetical protein
MDFADDLSFFYAEFGVEVVHTPKAGGASTPGLALHDQPGMTMIGGDILATDHSLRYPLATFPVVHKGDTFLIAGVTYAAREKAQPLQDGLEYTVPLAKA